MNSVHEQFRRSFLGLLLAVVLWERWSLMTPSSQRLEQISLDFRYSFFSPFHAPSQKVVFVDINEESLAAINKSEGPWPWKRDIWKDSVHLLSLGQPKAILFDVLLTESDKLNLSSDKKFAETIKKIPFVSLPLSFETTQNQQKDRLPASNRPFDLDIENKKTAADMFGTFSRPYSPLWESLSHVHVVNAIKDNDGKFRSTPFFFNYNSEIFPSLTLKALQIYLSDPKMKITSSEFLLSSGTKTLRVPLDHLQQFRFHFYKSEFQSVSLAYLYALDKKWKKDQLTSPQIKASAQRQFKDKILIIGSSASELQDIKSTPISRAYPGALLHATAISNILEGHYLKDLPEQSALLVSVLIVAFIYLLIFYAKNLFLKTLFPLIFLALFTVSCLYLFQVESINIPMASPILFGLLGYFDGIFKST